MRPDYMGANLTGQRNWQASPMRPLVASLCTWQTRLVRIARSLGSRSRSSEAAAGAILSSWPVRLLPPWTGTAS